MFENEGLIAEFYEDTQAHLENIEVDVLKLEKDHSQSDLIDAVFRRVHSIKGNSGMLGLDQIRVTGEVFETFLDKIRERRTATSEEIDKMFTHLDALKKVVSQTKGETGEPEIRAEETPAEAEPMATTQEISATPGDPMSPVGQSAPQVESKPRPAGKADNLDMVDDEDDNARNDSGISTTYLTFKLEKEHYGVDIMKVREIILREEITPVPNTDSFVLGVMNLRDQIIPVFNLKKKLNIEDYDKSIEEKNIIVIEIQKVTTGLRVEEVTGIVTLGKDQISPANDFSGSIPTDYLHGIGQSEEETIILIDVNDLCDPEEKLFKTEQC
ncbi:hypothetical protein MNBD_NITROSPINAE02-1272 [hydrothermal vent metagenome]|uniref:Signal transduction histidine kinase CheA n=1 Tax=hydrothermal vent metagenome TaxID=652676 RepID=A0A3B1BYV8_9ZZZZ